MDKENIRMNIPLSISNILKTSFKTVIHQGKLLLAIAAIIFMYAICVKILPTTYIGLLAILLPFARIVLVKALFCIWDTGTCTVAQLQAFIMHHGIKVTFFSVLSRFVLYGITLGLCLGIVLLMAPFLLLGSGLFIRGSVVVLAGMAAMSMYFYVATRCSFFECFLVDHLSGPIEALQQSKQVTAQPGVVKKLFLLYLLTSMLYVVGAVTLIGLVIVLPIIDMAIIICYRILVHK